MNTYQKFLIIAINVVLLAIIGIVAFYGRKVDEIGMFAMGALVMLALFNIYAWMVYFLFRKFNKNSGSANFAFSVLMAVPLIWMALIFLK